MLVWILLGTAFCVDGFRIENRTQLAFGRDLIIPFSRRAVVLYFSPLDSHLAPVMAWSIQDPGLVEWRRGRSDGRRWILEGVTYDDQGKYTQHDSTNHILSSVILTVKEERHYYDRHVNGTMTIPLRVPLADAQLSFTPEGATESYILVRQGALDTPEESYRSRLQLGLSKIILEDLTEEDSGQYELRDRSLNLVSSTRLRVGALDDSSGNPYLGLLALLGVGGGIFCCVRKKKCCKKKGPHMQEETHTPEQPNAEGQVFYHPTPTDPGQPNWSDPACPPQNWVGPAGPPPNWNGPAGPAPNWSDPAGPPPNWNGPAGPPPNWNGPAAPPPNWAGAGGPSPGWAGPAGPPQNWTGPPPEPNYGPNPSNIYPPMNPQPQWTPGPQAPQGYAPVMYSAPPLTGSEPVREEKEPTATDRLTPADTEASDAKQNPASPSFALSPGSLQSSEPEVQFQIDKDARPNYSTPDPLGTRASETVNFL